MTEFAIMCNVSFDTEVYVEADSLPEAMEKIAAGDYLSYLEPWLEDSITQKIAPLEFIKPQVWDDEKSEYVPCNVVMFPVKDEVDNEIDFEGED